MTVARDTSTAARHAQVEALRRLTGPTRLQMALRMSDDSRAVTLAGIRHRHPEWTDDDVHRELLRLLLGPELATEGQSERQLRDVVAILATQGAALDEAYIGRWVRALGIENAWSRARQMQGP